MNARQSHGNRGQGPRYRLLRGAVLFLWLISSSLASQVDAREKQEYKVKAGWLVNFIRYVEWPQEKPSPTIVIGILGEDPFAPYDIAWPEKVGTSHLQIRQLGEFDGENDFSDCHLVFIAASEKKRIVGILEALDPLPIISVSEIKGFVTKDNGGIFNFLPTHTTGSFEVNPTTALEKGFHISSQLLSRAKQIVR